MTPNTAYDDVTSTAGDVGVGRDVLLDPGQVADDRCRAGDQQVLVGASRVMVTSAS